MSVTFGSASAVYHTVQPAPMRVKVLTLPQRPAATSVEVRRHSLVPVRFRGTIGLTASSRSGLRAKREAWEEAQGDVDTLTVEEEDFDNVRLMQVRFAAPKRVAGSQDYVCDGVAEFRQESV